MENSHQQFATEVKLEKDLQEARERLRAILEEIEDGYLEADLTGNITFCNAAFCRIRGYPPEKMIGLNYREYMRPEIARRVYEAFNKVYTTGLPNTAFDYEIIRADGEVRHVEISISLRRDLQDHPVGFRGIVRDITPRKQAEKELIAHRSRLEAIFRSVRDAIITVDPNMRIIAVNAAAEALCAIPAERLVGGALDDFTIPCDEPCRKVLTETLNTRAGIAEYQAVCPQKGAPTKKVVLSTAPLLGQQDEFLGAVLVIRDITRLDDLERELKERSRFHNLIGRSRPMQAVYRLLEDLADMETTVLITGESGTGKELVARALHNGGRRAVKPFVVVNCSALAENLLESELFGHVKGAFTGAIKDNPGRFQMAHKGTLVLDEIGDISPRIQLKLLRVLQEKSFERVGDARVCRVDVRVIACTHRNLKEMVRRGEFREDLYYRLKVMEIDLPPLRERPEDIPLLLEHFIAHFNRKYGKQIHAAADPVLKAFLDYDWPGNIRELEHAVERAFVLCRKDVIEIEHLPREVLSTPGQHRPRTVQKSAGDAAALAAALARTDWNKAKTARLLGINRRTLYRKLDQYGLKKPDSDQGNRM